MVCKILHSYKVLNNKLIRDTMGYMRKTRVQENAHFKAIRGKLGINTLKYTKNQKKKLF